MPKPFGENSMEDLAILSSVIFSEVTDDPKKQDADIAGLAGVLKNKLLQVGTIDKAASVDSFPGLLSDKYERSMGRQFQGNEEKLYKRIIQLSAGVISGAIPDPTEGADVAERFTGKGKKGEKTSGAHKFYKFKAGELGENALPA